MTIAGRMVLYLRACALFGLMIALLAVNVRAQDYYALLQKYKDEQAIITDIKNQLIIHYEKGTLVGETKVSTEKMLIGTLSPGLYNKEYIYHSYFNQLMDYDAEAFIPGKNGYKKRTDVITKTGTLKDEDIFFDDYQQTELSFSGLTAGSLIKTSYTISHTDLHMLPIYYFQSNLPVVKTTYEVIAPKFVNLKFVLKGADTSIIKETITENRNTITYTFTCDDVPAFKEYSDVPSNAWYAVQVVPYITSYQLPGDTLTEMLSDPAHLYSLYYSFIRNINTHEDEKLVKLVADITKDDHSQKEKAAHIYQWVQKNIHYVAFEDSLGGFVPRQAADIYSRRFGDCKDIASILIAMCRAAGIKAYFTWIGTREKPYTYEETPVPAVDNHMICTVEINGEWIFMDGTSPLIPFGIAPQSIQDKEAMIGIDAHNYKVIAVPELDAERNVITDSSFIRLSDNKIEGRSVISFYGYPSWHTQLMLSYYKNEDRDKVMRQINTRGSNKFVETNYNYAYSDTGNKDCSISSQFSVEDYVQKVDHDYIVNMNLNRFLQNDAIDTGGRHVASFFKYNSCNREIVEMEIPAGYHVSYLPPADTGALRGIVTYDIHYKIEGDKVVLSKNYRLLSMSIPAASFVAYNEVLEQLKKQYKESVVLTKD